MQMAINYVWPYNSVDRDDITNVAVPSPSPDPLPSDPAGPTQETTGEERRKSMLAREKPISACS